MAARSYHHGDLRKALLDAGEVELSERGVEKFSLRGVAKRAGVSHAAPAHHFRDKRGLLTALAQHGFEVFADRISGSGGAGGDCRADEASALGELASLITCGMAYVDFALTCSNLFSLMFASSWPDFADADLDRSSGRAFDHFVKEVRSVFAGEGLSEEEMHARAMANWSAVHGLAVLLLEGRMRSVLALPQPAREEAIRRILEIAASGVPASI